MYNKLFTKILDSSIWLAPDPHRLVWITLIAAMDEDGNAMFACVDNLAARARVTVEQAESAIKSFEAPDPKSGDPENEGRRIERFPGGWNVLNAHKYRALVTKAISREQTRLRTAKWREKKAVVTQCDAPVTKRDAFVTPSEAEAVSQSQSRSKKITTASATPPEFEQLKAIYPKRSGDQGWPKALRACSARIKEGSSWVEMADGAQRYRDYCASTNKEGTEFVKQASTFFGPDKHYLQPWTLPFTKGEVRQNSNINAALEWLGDSNG